MRFRGFGVRKEEQPGARRSVRREAFFPVLCRGPGWLLRLAAFLMLALPLGGTAQAQSFVQQFALGGGFVSPEALGMPPGSAPPDLDEPEVGDDTETAPSFSDGKAQDSSGKKAQPPAARAPAKRFHAGQSHEAAPPLPLGQRLRRVLRDSPLGGGRDFWFERNHPTDVYFLAFESTARDRFLSFGAKHAVRGTLNEPGWRFLSTLGIKVAAYDPTLDTRASRVELARLLPGYEIRLGSLTLSAYAGLGYARSDSAGVLATGRFGRYGLSALGEFWQDWSRIAPALGRFTSGYVILESANRSAALGIRHGMQVAALPFLIGPEASWSGGRTVLARGARLHSAYRKQRLGLHASEIPLFAARLRLSGGVEWRERGKTSGYAEMAAYIAY